MKKKFKDFLSEAYIDKDGNLMDFNFDFDDENNNPDANPNNLYVKIGPFDTFGDDTLLNDFENVEYEINFYRKKDNTMVDNHMCDLYPMLNRSEYDDGGEGSLAYFGNKNLLQLKEYFKSLGFEVRD